MPAAMAQGTDIPGVTHEHFVQYVAYDVDHNVCTLDGLTHSVVWAPLPSLPQAPEGNSKYQGYL